MKFYRFLGKDCRITIPLPLRKLIDIRPGDLLSFEETEDGAGVIVHLESICDCCEDECWEDPEDIDDGISQADTESEDEDSVTLFDFLNTLSPQQKRAALVHLSLDLSKED